MAEGESLESDKVNPFSFSNFVLNKEDQPTASEAQVESVEPPSSDVQEENPFSFQSFKSKKQARSTNKPRKLKIVDIDNVTDIFADLPTPSSPPPESKVSSENQKQATASTVTEGKDAEDNLSDTSINSNGSPSPQTDSYLLTSAGYEAPSSDLLDQLQELKAENAELIRELEKTKKNFRDKEHSSSKRINTLEGELEKVRKREAEDTKVLEDAVKMVEQNLQKSTERAVDAEATVTRLKDEMRRLKENQVSLSDFNNLKVQHIHQLNTIKEKSQNAARLMRTAADKTEPHVRKLQSGISSLRFLSDVFDDLGTVTELPRNSGDFV